MRGLLGDRGPDEAPRLGLAGMAPPQVARRSLSEIEADLLPRPVKAPITPSDVLPAPVAPRIKTPLPPVTDGETEPAQVLTPAANLDEPALDPVQRALPSVEPSVPEPSQVLTPAANLDEPALDQVQRALPPITDSEPQPSQVLTPASELPEPEQRTAMLSPVSGRILAPAGSTPPATARLVPRQVLAVDQDPAEAPVSDRDAAAMIDRLTAGTAMLRPRKVMGVTEDE